MQPHQHKNLLIIDKKLPSNRSIKCLNNYQLDCGNYASVITLMKGMYLSTGIRNKFSDIDENIFINMRGQTSEAGEEADIIGKRVLFVQPLIDETNMSYGISNNPNSGAILISRLTQNIDLVAVDNINCVPYFDTKEDYQSDAFQCFCKGNLRGYANISVYKGEKSLSDIAICGMEEIAVPIGYIKNDDYGNLRGILRDAYGIGRLVIPISLETQFDPDVYNFQIKEIQEYKTHLKKVSAPQLDYIKKETGYNREDYCDFSELNELKDLSCRFIIEVILFFNNQLKSENIIVKTIK